MGSIRKINPKGELYVPIVIEDICSECDEVIEYPDVYDGQIFITIDDRAFHPICWEAWLLDNERSEAV